MNLIVSIAALKVALFIIIFHIQEQLIVYLKCVILSQIWTWQM